MVLKSISYHKDAGWKYWDMVLIDGIYSVLHYNFEHIVRAKQSYKWIGREVDNKILSVEN
jgi:hypothetical protein